MTTSPFDADRPPEPPRRSGGGRRRRRRRGDPNATVPDAEFTSYYGRNVVKPAPWGHEIAAYLFLGGAAAGSALVGAGGHFTGRPRLQAMGRYGALGYAGLGGIALIADLGRPERAINMMRTVKLTSPMSVGSWILTAFLSSAGAATACELAGVALSRRSLTSRLLRPSVARRANAVLRVANPVATAGSAFFAPPLAAYTAVLLSDTATPTWHESYRHLPFIFVSSATAAGCGWALVTVPPAETGPVRALAAVAGAVDLGVDTLLDRHLGMLAEPRHQGKAGRLHRAATVLTAVGSVGAALAGRRRSVAVVSGLALLAGSACTRFAIFDAGIESAKDPRYTVVPQRERAAARLARGEGITQPGGAWPT